MPQSQFVSARRLKPLIVYCAVAFLVLLAIDRLVRSGSLGDRLVLAWIVLFPVGAWLVFRRG